MRIQALMLKTILWATRATKPWVPHPQGIAPRILATARRATLAWANQIITASVAQISAFKAFASAKILPARPGVIRRVTNS